MAPSIFEYFDYRKYLEDYVQWLGKSEKLSLRAITKHLGFKSSSYLKMVFQHQRNLKPETIERFSKALGFNDQEFRYFKTLVKFNQSLDLEDKNVLMRKLIVLRKAAAAEVTVAAQFDFFKNWYVAALFEAFGTPWRKLSKQELMKALQISSEEFDQAVELLEKLALIRRDGRTWKKSREVFQTPPELESFYMRNFHQSMIEKSLESLKTKPPIERGFNALTIALSQKAVIEIKKKIFEFHQELNADYAGESNPVAVYQINSQIFPLVEFEVESSKIPES